MSDGPVIVMAPVPGGSCSQGKDRTMGRACEQSLRRRLGILEPIRLTGADRVPVAAETPGLHPDGGVIPANVLGTDIAAFETDDSDVRPAEPVPVAPIPDRRWASVSVP